MKSYAETLESYLIPAEEGAYLNELKDTAKSQVKEFGKAALPQIGVLGIICAALGIYSKIKTHNEKKAREAKTKSK